MALFQSEMQRHMINIDTISPFCILRGLKVKILYTGVLLSMKIVYILANSANPDEMPTLLHFIRVFTVCQSTCVPVL